MSHYYKHSELVAMYHVSLKTVYNWIDSAKEGKTPLMLEEHNGKSYVSKNASNLSELIKLASRGQKYRNSTYHKIATPDPAFYKLYSRQQILDIITNLKVHREIPRQYNYFDEGAKNWDEFANHMFEDESSNILRGTISLLHANQGTIDRLIRGYSKVNIIDIGPGNGLPVKELLAHLLDLGVLHRYIAIDISEEMLHIAERNIKAWFGDKVRFEGYTRDIASQRFDDLLVDDMLGKDAEQTINMALYLGGTLKNFRTPFDSLKVIYGSLGKDDLLIFTGRPDTAAARQWFGSGPGADPSNHRFIFDLLNINQSYYDIEMDYDSEKESRFVRVRLNVALTIHFKMRSGERKVTLEKGETILLLRIRHMSALRIISDFEKTGFSLLQASTTKDRQFLLTISGVDTKPEPDANCAC